MLTIKKECTGCMACLNSCPAGAIQSQLDEYGFVVPVIQTDKCLDCGLCDQVCPISDLPEGKDKRQLIDSGARVGLSKPIAAFSMFHKDPELVKISSSGGAFYALACQVLEEDGIVFGCYYDLEQRSAYLADTDHLDLKSLLTSKYVESYIGDGLSKVKEQVEKGRKVLFCGSPCQAAGLKAFLGKDYDNLLIVDFACGGVAAQPYLKDYINGLEQEYQAVMTRMSFRDKHYGWGQYCFLAEFDNGEIYRKTAMADPYFFCFLRSSMQRLSCHGCHFSDDHKGDICLSDFWKCDYFDVDRNDRKGISLALAYSTKGQKALEELDHVMHMEALDLEAASYHLHSRACPESKLEEIYTDMLEAYQQGVVSLRNRLLTEEQRKDYDLRQQIMDDPELAASHKDIVGNGQIMVVK